MTISAQRVVDLLDLGQSTNEARKRAAPKRPRNYPPEQVRELVNAARDAVLARLRRIAIKGEKLDPQTSRILDMLGAEMGIVKPKLDAQGKIDTSSPFDAKPARAPRGQGSKNRKRDQARDRKAGIEPGHDDELASMLSDDAHPGEDR